MLEFLKYDMRGLLIVSVELSPLSSAHIFNSYKVCLKLNSSSFQAHYRGPWCHDLVPDAIFFVTPR